MDIYDFFIELLRNKKAEGMTDDELAKKAQCSQAKINSMLNGTKKKTKAPAKTNHDVVEKVEFSTLVNLFPEVFDGILKRDGGASNGNSPGAAAASGNGVAISGNVTLGGGAVEATSLDQLQSAILDDGKMCAECKVRVLKMIKARK